MDLKLIYSAPEAAKAASVSLPTLYQWLNREGFPVFRTGRKYLIPVKAFERWLEEQAGIQYRNG